MKMRWQPSLQKIPHYESNNLYIDSCATKIRATQQHICKPDKLLFSFHGIPQSYVCDDAPYQSQCLTTASLIAKEINLDESQYEVAFQ